MLRKVVAIVSFVVTAQLAQAQVDGPNKLGGKCRTECADRTSTACKTCNENAKTQFSDKMKGAKEEAEKAVTDCKTKTGTERKTCFDDKRKTVVGTKPEGQQETADERKTKNEKLVEFEKVVQDAEKEERVKDVKDNLLDKMKKNEGKAAIEQAKKDMCTKAGSKCANEDGSLDEKALKICIMRCAKESVVDMEKTEVKTCFDGASTDAEKSACFCKTTADDAELDKIDKRGDARKVDAGVDFMCEEYSKCAETGASDCSDALDKSVTLAKEGCKTGKKELKANNKEVKAKCERKQVDTVFSRCKAANEDKATAATTDELKAALRQDINQCIKDATGMPTGKVEKLKKNVMTKKLQDELLDCRNCRADASESGVETDCPDVSTCKELVKKSMKKEYGSDCEGNYKALVEDGLADTEKEAAGTDQLLDVPKKACEVILRFKNGRGQCRGDGKMRPQLKDAMTDKASTVDGVGKAGQDSQVEWKDGDTAYQVATLSLALSDGSEPEPEPAGDMSDDAIEQKCEQLAASLKTSRRLSDLSTSDISDISGTQATQTCLASDTSCQSSELEETDTTGNIGGKTSGTNAISLSMAAIVAAVSHTILAELL